MPFQTTHKVFHFRPAYQPTHLFFYHFRTTYSFSKPASQPTHPFLSLLQGIQLIQFHLSTNRLDSCRRCIPNRAQNHCLFIYRLRASFFAYPIGQHTCQTTSLPDCQPTSQRTRCVLPRHSQSSARTHTPSRGHWAMRGMLSSCLSLPLMDRRPVA